MSFPADAFTRLDMSQTQSGTFALLKGDWVFHCQFDPEWAQEPQILWFTGENAGKVSDLPNEVVLAIAPEYSIQVCINSPAELKHEYQQRAGVIEIVSGGGVEFWASKWDAPHYVYAFDLAGNHSRPDPRERPMLTFESYECWLHKDGGVVGDAPLFAVSPR